MNINLATIDFCPGNGGGEAVIQSLNVTENGEYTAPSGVDGYNPVRVAVSGGSITPEEKAALDTLVDASQGVLATRVLEADKSYNIPSPVGNTDYGYYLFNLDGDIYMYSYALMYKWNPDTFAFDYVRSYSTSSTQPLWTDMTGRLYEGDTYELDWNSGTVTSVNLNLNGYDYSGNKHSIWKGAYGVYNFGYTSQKFNESTQEFESFTVNITPGALMSAESAGKLFAMFGFEYDGHFITNYTSEMYELKEYEDHIDIEIVSNPYYPMEIAGSYPDAGWVICAEGDLYFIQYSTCYKLVSGTWTPYSITDSIFSSNISRTNIYKGLVLENYLFAFNENNVVVHTYNLIHLSEDVIKTAWVNPNMAGCVDLTSQQQIGAHKDFASIGSDQISIQNVNSRSNNTVFDLSNTTFAANKVLFQTEGEFSLNGTNIATTDQCMVNRTILPYGSRSTDVVSYGNPQPYSYNYWTTHTGRLFYNNGYEFDGTQWVSVQNPLCSDGSSVNQSSQVINTGTNTFYNDNGNTYLWDDANSVFNLIATNFPGTSSDYQYIWPCDGGSLRFADTHKLVNNGGTWSWEADQLNDYYNFGMTYVINGNVYVLSNDNGGTVYQYDESTKAYTNVGMFNYWTGVSFSFNGEIFFPWNASSIRKIDFTKIGGSDPYIDVETNIPYTNYGWFYGGYDSKLYYYRTYSTFAYCYDIDESLPEVPASNGTYVLQATRSGDTITYEWVPSNV